MVSELDEIRRRVRNIWGAISSNQVVDKDVEGQAKRLLEYIDALASLPTEPVQVGVKKLEWDEVSPGVRDALGAGILYRLLKRSDGTAELRIDSTRYGQMYPSTEAARAAAQADYEQRIRSCLTPAQPANFEQAVEAAVRAYADANNSQYFISSHEAMSAALRAALPMLGAGQDEAGADWQFDAFRQTVRLAREKGMTGSGSLSLAHIMDMERRLSPSMSRGKVGRWLGWVQAALIANEVSTLDDMKSLNKRCSQEKGEAKA